MKGAFLFSRCTILSAVFYFWTYTAPKQLKFSITFNQNRNTKLACPLHSHKQSKVI